MLSPSRYYHNDLSTFLQHTLPTGSRVGLHGKALSAVYDYIVCINSFAYTENIQAELHKIKKHATCDTKVVVVYYNFLWRPLLSLATALGLRTKDTREPNWITPEDFRGMFSLEDFDEVTHGNRFIVPIDLGFISVFVNKYLAPLPLLNHLCLTTYQIFRLRPPAQDYTTSVIIPARNEAGNIKGILKKIPVLGKSTEVVFVEGHSKDNTLEVIASEVAGVKSQGITARYFKQKGKGKADAVRLGFSKAQGDILIILDADLTVAPKDLLLFYRALADGHGDFANGSRMTYPMEDQAMRTLNYFGNRLFSALFSYLLGQQVRDTLCGTKVLFRNDYQKVARARKAFGDFDPFGDFDLLFGAAKLNLKIVDIPVRYHGRVYGTTNIRRFTHGWLLIKMTLIGARRLKFT